MNLRRLFKNQFFTLLTQGEKHESLFEKEIHGHTSQPPLPEGARRPIELIPAFMRITRSPQDYATSLVSIAALCFAYAQLLQLGLPSGTSV